MMTGCPIFQTFSAAKAISTELDQLVGDIVARLRRADPDLFKQAEKYEWDDCLTEEELTWLWTGGALTIQASMKKGAGTPKVRNLSLRFDLTRLQEEQSSWRHASEALIVVGYSPLKDRPWENELLAVTANGRLRDDGAWEACKTNRHAGGRLLQYTEAGLVDGATWAQRPWIFAIPLRSLENPDSVDKHIIQPIISLLVKNDAPDKSLTATDAITWRNS
jgi:hypothetical protein